MNGLDSTARHEAMQMRVEVKLTGNLTYAKAAEMCEEI
jgi:hypothetical protein